MMNKKLERRNFGKLLAFLFMDGADRKIYGFLMKNLAWDCALGNGMYPVTMEDALQVFALNTPRTITSNKGKIAATGLENCLPQVKFEGAGSVAQ